MSSKSISHLRYIWRHATYTLKRTASLRGRHLALFLALFTFLFLCLTYAILRHLHYGGMGRWYWNWEVAFHPLVAYIVPPAWWSRSINWEPTYFQEINDAPYMGTFPLPELSPPQWGNITQDHGYWYHDSHPLFGQSPPLRQDLTSPVILKLHVFTSSVHAGKREKRDLIRKVDPRLRLPKAYRHLVELKFVMGHAYKEDWTVDEEKEKALEEEQKENGDLLRLPHLFHGENLREGKILDWIEYVGSGQDGGRPAWYLFKMDDDTVVDLPVFLDTLLAQDPKQPIYLGTSLARWPAYHFHFTGMLTGFSYSLYRTLAAGIGKMSRKQIEDQHDDDVLTGEVMFGLPSGPQCRPPHHPLAQPYRFNASDSLPSYCNPHRAPPWGWLPPPPSPDPRTGLIRYDYLTWMGDPAWYFTRNPRVCTHGWDWKWLDTYEREALRRAEAGLWKVPKWLEQFADPDLL